MELDKRQAELEREIQGIKDDFSSRQDELNHQFQLQMAEQDQTLQAELQAKRISSAEYMQGRDLAQSEAEFARKLASQQLEADRQFQLQERQQQLDVVVEARQERLLQAQLAANPQDFVAYEFYKRNLGDPQDLALASKIQQASGGTVTGGASGTPSGTLSGTPFPDAPPAYDDETLRKVLSGLQNQGGQPLYNPRLGGTGVFGANIPSPNDISRSDANALTDSELGILSSFFGPASRPELATLAWPWTRRSSSPRPNVASCRPPLARAVSVPTTRRELALCPSVPTANACHTPAAICHSTSQTSTSPASSSAVPRIRVTGFRCRKVSTCRTWLSLPVRPQDEALSSSSAA